MYKKFLNWFFGKPDEPAQREVHPLSIASQAAISAAADVYGYLARDSEFPGPRLLELLNECRKEIEEAAPDEEALASFRLYCAERAQFFAGIALARGLGQEEVVGHQS